MNPSPTIQKLQLILNTIERLKPIPTNATRVLNALDSNEPSIETVAGYVGLDQALSALILRASNTAALGYARTCTTLQSAVMRLGFKRVRSLVLAGITTGTSSRPLSGYQLGAGELWNHGVATAMAAEWLARALDYEDPEEAYAAGLLHDMGKLILDQFVLRDYTRIIDVMNKCQWNLWQAEQELLGIDHATVGSMMAEKWEFPNVLVETIHFHHAPSLARSRQVLPAIVNFANSVACSASKSELDMFNKSVHSETPSLLRLDPVAMKKTEDGLRRYLGL